MNPGTKLKAGPKGANVRSGPGTQHPVLLAAKAGAVATATGKESGTAPKRWYQVGAPDGRTGWVSETVVIVGAAGSDDEKAKSLLIRVVDNDKQTFTNALAIIKKMQALKKKGVDVTAAEKRGVKIATEFLKRQREIQGKLPKNAYKGGLEEGAKLLEQYARGEQLGFVPIPIIMSIITASLVGLGIGKLFGFFSGHHDRSEINLKESELLKKALDSLTPAEQAEVRADLENQLDTTYDEGRKDEKKESGGIFGTIKKVGIGLIVGIAAIKGIEIFSDMQAKKRPF